MTPFPCDGGRGQGEGGPWESEELFDQRDGALGTLCLGEVAGVMEAGRALPREDGLEAVEFLAAERQVLHPPEDERRDVVDPLAAPPEAVVPLAAVEQRARIGMGGHALGR